MRFLAVDAVVSDGLPDLLDLSDELNVDRLVLFRAAAAHVAARAKRERDAADERYLAAVADHLLANRSAPTPRRDVDDPRLALRAVAVVPSSLELLGISRTDLAVEILGAQVVMAVPDRMALVRSGEDVHNATCWLAGGVDRAELQSAEGRPLLSPGAWSDEGGAILLDVKADHIEVELRNAGGRVVRGLRHELAARARVSVRG